MTTLSDKELLAFLVDIESDASKRYSSLLS